MTRISRKMTTPIKKGWMGRLGHVLFASVADCIFVSGEEDDRVGGGRRTLLSRPPTIPPLLRVVDADLLRMRRRGAPTTDTVGAVAIVTTQGSAQKANYYGDHTRSVANTIRRR